MKRVTIAMDDDLYRDLLEYAADQSKMNVRKLSIGEAVRSLIVVQLNSFGYIRSAQGRASQQSERLAKPPYLAKRQS